jgi:hypothetical protein
MRLGFLDLALRSSLLCLRADIPIVFKIDVADACLYCYSPEYTQHTLQTLSNGPSQVSTYMVWLNKQFSQTHVFTKSHKLL